ncbi:MAG TPA: YeiH family protein [Spirochaetota bacterium]|nr:YeiH family protein [Spirochaetota bacterium]HOR45178.1 YeiH family protein [Spirochaetota bacterium]HQE57870.1 YeiH family protein [Spirochaetota bacterium]
MNFIKKNIYGILLSAAVAAVAYFLGRIFPVVGGAVFGILLGMIINNTFGKPDAGVAGIRFTGKKVLQWSIILLGAGLSMNQVAKAGMTSFFVMIFTLSAAFIAAYVAGYFLKIPFKLKSLIGTGTAICGGSAIAALSPVIDADEHDISFSISTVFLFNIAAVFIFPAAGHVFGFSNEGFGLWAGTAINDTSSVVAAAYSFSKEAGDYATVVKLARTLLIVPICLIYALVFYFSQKKATASSNQTVRYSFIKIFPWFVLGFLFMSMLRSTEIIPVAAADVIAECGKIAIIFALSAIGLNADFRRMFKTGIKPVILGLIVWAAVTLSSLAVQFVTGKL